LGLIMAAAEETDLVIRFGEPYIKYRAKTGMFLPKSKNTAKFIQDVKDLISGLFRSNGVE